MQRSRQYSEGMSIDSEDESSRGSFFMSPSDVSLMNQDTSQDDSASLLDGRTFYNTYELHEVLGRGMASTVRRTVEKKTDKNFAVKIVDVTTEHQSPKDAARLDEETKAEVAILRELQGHPNIIELHDYCETKSYLFLVFEMAPLGELFDMLTREVTFSEKRTKRIMRQVLEGLEYMHSKNIVHRDMKLENILCISQEKIVLTDFGFAQKLQPNERLKELCGTPGYLAPEALRSQMYEDSAGYHLPVDCWASGVILYTLLAGYAPFYHHQQMRMLRMIQEGRYEFKREQWDTISNDAKDLIRNLLCVDQDQRYTVKQALDHPFLAKVSTTVDTRRKIHAKRRFQRSVDCVRFLIRLTRMPDYNREIDRAALMKRPYRDRQIRHESEATVFLVFGHWVQKGYKESRDMLFANQPRPKRRKQGDEAW